MRKLLPLLGLSLLGCDPAPTPPPAPTAPPTANTAASPEAPATAPTAVPTAAPTAMVPDRPESAPGLEQLAEGQNAFGFELFQNLDQEGNLVSSPASVGMALAMTYMGARGATAAEMSKTLRLTQEQSALEKGFATLLHDWQRPEPAPADVENAEPLTVRIANRIFGESTLKVDDRFRDLTRRGFGAPLEGIDFKNGPEPARAHINDWVEQQTEKRIVDLLPPRSVTSETRMVLANAIFFKSPWAEPFQKHATAPASFHVDGKTEAKVPTMHRTDRFLHAAVDGLAIVEIPLHGRFAFDVILPDAKDGLPAAERILSGPTWKRWISALTSKPVKLSLPKFRIEGGDSLSLRDPLTKMGIVEAFDRNKADFTGIANPPSPADRLLIGDVFHKAFVDVNEAGVEAAAATAVVMPRAGSAPNREEPIAFTVDHPFLFAIRDTQTGAILFLGRVTDPKAPAD